MRSATSCLQVGEQLALALRPDLADVERQAAVGVPERRLRVDDNPGALDDGGREPIEDSDVTLGLD